jgi:hypothetical protein
MSRSMQTKKGRGRSRVVAALGAVAGALSLAGGASASSPADTAPVILAEEEISDVSLATFYVFDKENAPIPGVRLAGGGIISLTAHGAQDVYRTGHGHGGHGGAHASGHGGAHASGHGGAHASGHGHGGPCGFSVEHEHFRRGHHGCGHYNPDLYRD